MTSPEQPLRIRSRGAPVTVNGRTLPLRAEDLQQILPHRNGMALIDRVTEVEPGRRAAGQRLIARNDPALQGHFPGRPIVPGVLVIESLAQLCGVVLWSAEVPAAAGLADDASAQEDPGSAGLGVLAGVKRFRFHRLVVPGDVVSLEARLTVQVGGLSDFNVHARVDREAVAQGSIQIGFRRVPPAPSI